MDGFSEEMEIVCNIPKKQFSRLQLGYFTSITVEPVPNLGDAPDELLTVSFLKTVAKQHSYHQKRIEREGKA